MKIKLIILLLLFTSWQANAQKAEYYKLIDTGKVWYSVWIGEFGEIEAQNVRPFETFFYANDTVYIPIGYPPASVLIIVREDTLEQKVYSRGFIDFNIPNGPEELLYDFSLEEGDSVYLQRKCYTSAWDWFYVDSLRTKTLFSVDRKVWYLNNHYPNAPNLIWIEGIGSLGGIEYSAEGPNIWECGELTCCYLNNDMIYQSANGAQWGCEFELVDQTPPVIDSIWFEPDTITSTDTIRFYVKANDNLSGIASFLSEIHPPVGEEVNIFGPLSYQTEDIYFFELNQFNWDETGTWYSNFVVVYDNAGNERVKYFDYDAVFFVNDEDSIPEVTDSITEVILFPNPVVTHSKLQFPNSDNKLVKLNIYNILGVKVRTKQTSSEFFEISRSEFNSGIYIYTLSSNNQIISTNKFIIR